MVTEVGAAELSTEELLHRIEAQQRQIDELHAALTETKAAAETAAAETAAAKTAAAQAAQEPAPPPSFLDTVQIGGLAEVELTDTEDFTGQGGNDITLSKVELFVDAQPHKYLSTHVQAIYEDDGNETIELDEAFAIVGNTEEFPVFLQAGKWALPFGGFDTAMSSDPLTQDLGETKEAAVLVGAEYQGFHLAGFGYNGDTQKAGRSNYVDQFGLAAGYAGETGDVTYSAGVGYINNIADSDGLTDGLGGVAGTLDHYVAGFEGHGEIGFRGFAVRGGYLTTLDSFEAGELAFNTQGARPAAWNAEAAYTVPILTKEATFAATVQGTREALALGLPELRMGGAVTVGLFEHLSVTGEYLHNEDYKPSDGGTGSSGHSATLKLAAEY
ncbi:LbtU family siderophore porin [Marivibrio halodurans]|uniref:LbtU family siderophore porin n=1 Tax=Marivibrio halodurans TaxID=2039722 RepID=A0A8J7S0A0_9PROT|nr:LbtU family siderophore porin [Marivibrio halodurans]MBP5857930.1 LbtU family siderophore porin [Marivibrio halodurans]